MRKFKRLASLALAAVMTLGMCAPAFATGGEPQNETTYKVYQIFTGTYAPKDTEGFDKDTLGNLQWGKNSKYYNTNENHSINEASNEEKTAVESIHNATGDTAAHVAVVKEVLAENTTPVASGTVEQIKEVQNLEPGYYLVEPDSNVNGAGFVIKVLNGSLDFTEKVSVPTIDKTVNNGQHVAGASIGEQVEFKIEATLPSNINQYKSYYLKFEDTMSKGLTLDESTIKVAIGNSTEDYINYFYKAVTEVKDTEEKIVGTKLVVSTSNIKAIDGLQLKGDDVVTITYKATINENAEVGTSANTNEVTLKYSNDPSKQTDGDVPSKPTDPEKEPDPDGPTGDTVTPEEPQTKIYVTGLTITDFAGTIPMTGAKFTLTGKGIKKNIKIETDFVEIKDGETGVYYKLAGDKGYTAEKPTTDTLSQYENATDVDQEPKYKLNYNITTIDAKDLTSDDMVGEKGKVQGVIDANGALTFTGLGIGEYTLHQDEALPGYNMASDITFGVEYKADTNDPFQGAFDKTNGSDSQVSVLDNWFYINLQQGRGSLLPETGGVGTTMMYIGGMLLIAMAGATIILKGKKAEDTAE